ncbi:MAG: HAD-IIIA family hydrolase [Gemmatimonadetes bacterium]|nr:HAD-IIIA family hydrolase [Gemmatimonadota bacterium]
MTNARRPVAFLDRDGTIIEDVHYIRDPDDVALIPGVAHAIRRLNRAGWAVVVITNQSGIGRGQLTEADYQAVRERTDALLLQAGAMVDAHYHCPHAPDAGCDCRKPRTLLHRQAIADLALDAARVTSAGDRWRDVEPALTLGGRGFLVPGPDTPSEDLERASQDGLLVPTLDAAVDRMLGAG